MMSLVFWKRCSNLIVLASGFNNGLGCKTFAQEPGEVTTRPSRILVAVPLNRPKIFERAETIGIGKDSA